jgi:hypothetical protein
MHRDNAGIRLSPLRALRPARPTSPPPFRNHAAHNRRPGCPERSPGGEVGGRGAGPGLGECQTRASGRTSGASAGRRRRAQLQSNRSGGGGRGGGTSVGSPRWVRIFRMRTRSSMVAMTRMRPPDRVQANTSTANVWRMRSGHDHLRGADGGGSSTVMAEPGSRPAAGLDDPGALGRPSTVTTEASRSTVLDHATVGEQHVRDPGGRRRGRHPFEGRG